MKRIWYVVIAVILIAAAFAGGRGFVTGDTPGLVSVAAPCPEPCKALESVAGQRETRLNGLVVQARPIVMCHYRQLPGGAYDQPYWSNEIGWAPVTWKAGQSPKVDFTETDGFAYGNQHPVYGEIAVMPKGGCPLLMRPDYLTVPDGG